MNGYRITVTYEFELDAPRYDMARQWALEEVERGHVIPSDVDVERLDRAARGFTYPPDGRKGNAAWNATKNDYPLEAGAHGRSPWRKETAEATLAEIAEALKRIAAELAVTNP